MFDAPQFNFYVNNFTQVVTNPANFYQPQQFFLPLIPTSNEFSYNLPSSSTLPQTSMPVERNFLDVNAPAPNLPLFENPPPDVSTIDKDDELSDSDTSCADEDESLTNPYVSIINSNIPKDKPSNWRSLVLFNGRISADDLPKDCPKPQSNDGSILPQIRPIIKKLLNPDGNLHAQNNSPMTMRISTEKPASEEPKSRGNRGYISANGLVWSKRKPETPVKAKPATNFPATQLVVRKRFSNQSLIIAGGKRIRTDNSNECIAFAQSGNCTAGYLCTFDHEGKTDHSKQQLCKSQMLGKCRKDANCNEGLHGLAKHQLPVCQYYLNMTCINDSCPYLHIKHNDKLEYCSAFQRGTCLLGLKCPKPHRFNPRVIASKCSQNSAAQPVSPVAEGSTPSAETVSSPTDRELPSWNF